MAELISCAKNTQLHSFPELELLSSSAHVDSNGSSDCQFFGSSKLFVRSNKNWGIELLRIKNGEQPSDDGAASGCPGGTIRTIASVRKMMVENLYCVACPKGSGRDEIAIGLTSGIIRFMNYKKANFTKRFNADGIAIGVTFLDFNANDQLLAAVYENGLINLYGMKTSVKCQTIPFDKNTIKARFHPTKRSILAMASYNGAIVQYDTQTRKPVFSQPTAHSAPCRDLAMVETYPDYLFSVGYDCVINIYDVRCKQPASQVQSNYPFESLAIANDGHRFAVGNLKGYVYGYDLRSLRDPLNMQKLHQSNVNSLAFVPQPQKDSSGRRSMFELEETCSASATAKVAIRGGRVSEGSIHVPEEKKNAGKHDHVPEQRDSFMGEIDMFLQRRDSPLDCMSRLSTSSRLSTESRNSMQMADNNLVGLLDDLSDCNLDTMEGKVNDSGEKSLQTSLGIDDSFVNTDRLLKRTKIEGSGRGINSSGDLQRLHRTAANSRMGENLEYIREEGSEMVQSDCEAGATRTSGNSSAGNRISSNRSSITSVSSNNSTHKATAGAASRVLIESQQGNLVSKPTSLTHSGATPEASQSDKENQARHLQLVSVKEEPHLLASHPSPFVEMVPVGDGNQTKPAHHRPDAECVSPGIRTEVEELRRTMLEQFQLSSLQHQDSERELRSYLWMGMFNLWRETQGKLESLEQTVSTGLGMLLAKDEFSQQFIATRAENETLKNRVRELEEKLQQFSTSSLKR